MGRAVYLALFPSVAPPELRACLPDPGDEETFRRCTLHPDERTRPGHAEVYQMYRDLLKLRRDDKAFRGRWPGGLDGAVLGNHTFALRYFEPAGDDRLVVVNLDSDQHFEVAPEPLLAPPLAKRWQLAWSSDHPRYGGTGALPLESPDESWRIPGRSASVLRPVKVGADQSEPLLAPPRP
jgi:maltooligosyltrehalose trehalohydrolase